MRAMLFVAALGVVAATRAAGGAQGVPAATNDVDRLKRDAVADVDRMRTMTQQMVDQVFSFGELGFQEFETSK
jgi:aminobenzoyl-glutamate utilization protein B